MLSHGDGSKIPPFFIFKDLILTPNLSTCLIVLFFFHQIRKTNVLYVYFSVLLLPALCFHLNIQYLHKFTNSFFQDLLICNISSGGVLDRKPRRGENCDFICGSSSRLQSSYYFTDISPNVFFIDYSF